MPISPNTSLSPDDAAAVDADLDADFDEPEDPEVERRSDRSQGYAKVESEVEDLPSRVGHAAAALFFCARLRSARLMEDGIIPVSSVRPLCGSTGLSLRGFKVAVDALVKDGKLKVLDDTNFSGYLESQWTGGWQDIGFSTWNPPSFARVSQRKKWRIAKQKQRETEAKPEAERIQMAELSTEDIPQDTDSLSKGQGEGGDKVLRYYQQGTSVVGSTGMGAEELHEY